VRDVAAGVDKSAIVGDRRGGTLAALPGDSHQEITMSSAAHATSPAPRFTLALGALALGALALGACEASLDEPGADEPTRFAEVELVADGLERPRPTPTDLGDRLTALARCDADHPGQILLRVTYRRDRGVELPDPRLVTVTLRAGARAETVDLPLGGFVMDDGRPGALLRVHALWLTPGAPVTCADLATAELDAMIDFAPPWLTTCTLAGPASEVLGGATCTP
jgi:hypothetical protein